MVVDKSCVHHLASVFASYNDKSNAARFDKVAVFDRLESGGQRKSFKSSSQAIACAFDDCKTNSYQCSSSLTISW